MVVLTCAFTSLQLDEFGRHDLIWICRSMSFSTSYVILLIKPLAPYHCCGNEWPASMQLGFDFD